MSGDNLALTQHLKSLLTRGGSPPAPGDASVIEMGRFAHVDTSDEFEAEVDRLCREDPAALARVLAWDPDTRFLINLVFAMSLSESRPGSPEVVEAVRRHLGAADAELRYQAHEYIAAFGRTEDFDITEKYVRDEPEYRFDSVSWLSYFPAELNDRCIDLLEMCMEAGDKLTVFFAVQSLDRIATPRAREAILKAKACTNDTEIHRLVKAMEDTWKDNLPPYSDEYFCRVTTRFYEKHGEG